MIATPPEALGPTVREQVFGDDHMFLIERPSESDRLFEHPGVRSTCAAVNYRPYRADLWPAARMLAKVIVREPCPPALQALAVGCGRGLPGIAGLCRGLAP